MRGRLLGLIPPALLATACAGAGVVGRPIHPLGDVVRAMDAQPRMVVSEAGGRPRRVAIDASAGYLAAFSSRRLMILDRRRIEYRRYRACYVRFQAPRIGTRDMWLGNIRFLSSHRYSVIRTRGRIVYRASGEQISVDPRTNRILGVVSGGSPAGGIPGYTTTYSYPRAIPELPAPANLCHRPGATPPPPRRATPGPAPPRSLTRA